MLEIIKLLLNIFKLKLNPDRIFGLDIIRALAIVFVVIEHGANLLPKNIKTLNNYLTFDGVNLFFVLSGFLIGNILINEFVKDNINYKILYNFWIRRWFRTLPNYFFILTLLIVLNILNNDDFNVLKTVKYFFFSQNINSLHPSFFPEAWSLSVEEWFYIIIPICLFIVIKLLKIPAKISFLFIIVIVVFATLIIRYNRFVNFNISTINNWDLLLRKQVITRLDSLMIGMFGAYFQYYNLKFWLKFKSLFFVFGLTLFVSLKIYFLYFETYDLFNCVFRFSVVSVATLFILPYLSNLKKGKGIFYKIITYISLISYSMYLINLSLIQFNILNKISFISNYKFLYILYWFLTILLSIVIYKYFELPIMKFRDKLKFNKND